MDSLDELMDTLQRRIIRNQLILLLQHEEDAGRLDEFSDEQRKYITNLMVKSVKIGLRD